MALQLLDPAARFPVKDSDLPGIRGGDPDTVYTLQPITVDDHRRLQKQYTRLAPSRRSQQMVEEVDFDALSDAVLDFVLVGWDGILFRGDPAPCVLAHKKQLDGARIVALKDLAGMNRIASASEVRAESFREPANVP